MPPPPPMSRTSQAPIVAVKAARLAALALYSRVSLALRSLAVVICVPRHLGQKPLNRRWFGGHSRYRWTHWECRLDDTHHSLAPKRHQPKAASRVHLAGSRPSEPQCCRGGSRVSELSRLRSTHGILITHGTPCQVLRRRPLPGTCSSAFRSATRPAPPRSTGRVSATGPMSRPSTNDNPVHPTRVQPHQGSHPQPLQMAEPCVHPLGSQSVARRPVALSIRSGPCSCAPSSSFAALCSASQRREYQGCGGSTKALRRW